jgi:uncharacterized YccA/Bax inhibitor family protein
MQMRTSNPAFAGTVWDDWSRADRRSRVMTIEGTATKALLLLAIATATASFAWSQMNNAALSGGLLIGSFAGGFVLALVTISKKEWAPVTAPAYAACEGILLGAISNLFNQRYPGIAMQAVSLTFGTMFLMLFLYGTRLIRVTDRLVAGIVAATGAVLLVYLVNWLLVLFGVQVPFLRFSSGPIGIVFSLFVVGLAAFNLLLDFDFIERGARYEAPKFLEWYGAFGLMVTLIWLYIEILNLLRKLQDRR